MLMDFAPLSRLIYVCGVVLDEAAPPPRACNKALDVTILYDIFDQFE